MWIEKKGIQTDENVMHTEDLPKIFMEPMLSIPSREATMLVLEDVFIKSILEGIHRRQRKLKNLLFNVIEEVLTNIVDERRLNKIFVKNHDLTIPKEFMDALTQLTGDVSDSLRLW